MGVMRCSARRYSVVVALALVVMAGLARAAEPQAPQPLRVAVYGSSYGLDNVHRALVGHMVKFRPDLVLHTGELVANGRRTQSWTVFDQAVKPLEAICRFHVSPGPKDGARYIHGRFPPPEGASGVPAHYSFDHKGAHFVILSPPKGRVTRSDPVTQWLDADLAAAQGKPIFVLYHHPFHSVVGKGRAGMVGFYWTPLFAKHKVHIVFGGAHHLYVRTCQDGVTYIVSGGGGARLDRIQSRRNILPNDVVAATHHYIEITIVVGDIRGRVVGPKGKTRDEFIIPIALKPASAKP